MARMTNRIKQEIINNAIKKAGIPERYESLELRRAQWAEEIRILSLGGKGSVKKMGTIETRTRKAVASLPFKYTPNEIFPTSFQIRVYLNNHDFHMPFSGKISPHCVKTYKVVVSSYAIPEGDPLVDIFEEMEIERESIDELRSDISSSVRGTLSKITTVAKLLQCWPEASELLPSLEKEKINLPMVLVKDLNAKIGLPSVKK